MAVQSGSSSYRDGPNSYRYGSGQKDESLCWHDREIRAAIGDPNTHECLRRIGVQTPPPFLQFRNFVPHVTVSRFAGSPPPPVPGSGVFASASERTFRVSIPDPPVKEKQTHCSGQGIPHPA